jgi:uncharacterized protein YndB with AHSA1/START domain
MEADMWWLVLGIALVIVGMPTAIWFAGMLLPKAHSVTRSATVAAPPDKVWGLVADFANEAKWNGAIKSSTRGSDKDGHEVWVTVDKRGGKLPLETVEVVAGQKLVRRIADPKLPYGGKWTITLAPDGGGTLVSVTEDGEVYNPIFRFIARTFMDEAATVNAYLNGLTKASGGAKSA